MITEDYVSYETAKLLKDKGFDENCAALYDSRTSELSQRGVGYVFNNGQWINFITAPTVQMVMKWLREFHRLCVVVKPYITEEGIFYLFEIKEMNKDSVVNKKTKTGFDTYEDACEAGIKYCLENLI